MFFKQKFVLCPLINISNKSSAVNKKLFNSKFLDKIGFCDTQSNSSKLVNKLKQEINDDNVLFRQI